MGDLSVTRDRRTVTPAVAASAIFVAACAVFAIAFVGARGGLQMPVAASPGPVAGATEEPAATEPASTTSPATAPPTTLAPPTSLPTPAPTGSAVPTAVPSPTPAPTVEPTLEPTFVVPTLEPGDPLLVLDECDDHPGCFEYVVVRGDTLSGIISRYLLDIDVLQALNGGLDNPNLVVVGQLLYLGRDPLARLDPCPGGEACALYVVQPGDSIAEIADRYILTRDAILTANPGVPRPLQAGQVLKLPR